MIAPESSNPIAPEVTFHSYGVELHPKLPPLPTEIFHILRVRVADAMAARALQKNIVLTTLECVGHANPVLAFFHFRGLCGKLYASDEATLAFLEGVIDWALEFGTDVGAVLRGAIENPDGLPEAWRPQRRVEPRVDRPPLPDDVYRSVRTRALAAMQLIAARKNLPPAVAKCAEHADGMVRFLHVHGLAEELLQNDPQAVELMEYGIDNVLDREAATEAVLASARAWGVREDQRDWEVLVLWIDEAFIRLRQRHRAGSFYRWPDVQAGMPVALAEFGMASLDVRGAIS